MSDQRPAARVQRVRPSPTIVISDRAKALRAAGEPVISLSAGEPDFDTPVSVRAAAVAAIAAGETRYTAVDGSAALKQAIAGKFARENGLHYRPDEILVSSGAKHSIHNALQALLDPGDEVLIPAPYWVSYPEMVRLADAEPVVIAPPAAPAGGRTVASLKLTPEALAAAITRRSRALLLNSPCNPSGAVYSADELAALAAVLREHPRLIVISDDIYEHIRWDGGRFATLAAVCPALAERTLVVNGVSKAYAMTGWRIGYAAGPAWLIAAMKTIQSQSTSNPCSVSQAAAAAALDGDQGCVASMVAAYRARHDWLVPALNAIPGVQAFPGEGTFYSFPDCSAAIAALGCGDDTGLAERLLEQARVAVVPGSAFGLPGHLRLSYACDQATLTEAVTRLAAVLSA